MKNKSNAGNNLKTESNDTTKNKIDKHLRDKDDTISEKDIENVNTEPSTDKRTAESTESDKDVKRKKQMPTSWNI